jgi:hypothetical protein
MSKVGELAARILKDLMHERIIPLSDQMRLRYLAHREEVTLPLEEIARRILARESETPMRVRPARQGGEG